MRLATCEQAGAAFVAVVADDATVIHLREAARRQRRDEAPFRDMLALIDAGAEGTRLAAELAAATPRTDPFRLPLSAVRLLPPLPIPRQMRDFMVFPEHIRDAPGGLAKLAGRAATSPGVAADIAPVYRQMPVHYITNRLCVAGPEDEVVWPAYSRVIDFELEVAAVIGKGGRDIGVDAAADHIFGYTIFNDLSARDMQLREVEGRLGPAKAKSFDRSNVIGPWIVTADDMPPIRSLDVEVLVNGERWATGQTATMLHSFEEMIAHVSQGETIHAGEIFGSGTVGGCCGLEIGRFPASGDTIELRVPAIGVLRNRVVDGETDPATP